MSYCVEVCCVSVVLGGGLLLLNCWLAVHGVNSVDFIVSLVFGWV